MRLRQKVNTKIQNTKNMAFIELTRYSETVERRFLINTDCITHVDVYAHGVGPVSVGSYVYVTVSEGVIAVRESYDQVVRLLTGDYSTVRVDSKIPLKIR